ncbi:MAG: DUF711 family protein [Anaerolineales bacterium]
MNIRTVTYFVDPAFPLTDERLAAGGRAMAEIRAALEAGGYIVQTVRLATTPFPRALNGDVSHVMKFALDLEAACFVHQFDCATLGPARPADGAAFYQIIPEVITATENVFAAAIIAEATGGVSLPAIRWAAEVIRRNATARPDGFGNLRFAALANIPPGSPFFPAAYHDGGTPTFSIGLEAADLAVSAFAEAATLADGRTRLIRTVEEHAQKIVKIAKRASGVRGLRFGGVDFSMAPYPEAARSLGSALERLTGSPAGERGTLAAAAFLADALDRAKFSSAGFSGLFFPVFEDAVLAARAAEGQLSVSDLLLYCAVCGTGLDTLPLPGDVSEEMLAALLVDVAALALRLSKPLAARLMPIPGKSAGDEVKYDYPYFAPTRVLDPHTTGLKGLLAGDETFDLAPRSR